MSQVFLLLSLLSFSSRIQVSSAESFKNVMAKWMMYRDECFRNISRDIPLTGVVCNSTFDKFACWPDGLPNTTVGVACPWYLPWHSEVRHGLVYLECDAEGQWSKQRNASECVSRDPSQINMQHYGRILSQFRTMYTVGYSLSLGALVLALGILVAFRKLHCMRNNIHMNLFASFILRASSILIKDAMLERPDTFHVAQDITTELEVEWLVENETAVGCRVAMVMMQYSILANSYWLLVEGIYLHSLLVVTVLTERNYFGIYLCIGWGAPLIFVLPWVIVKYLYENEECWVQNIHMEYWWIIRSPILLAVLINFFIFIHIIKILVSKLRAHQMRYSDYKFRLAKSTLTLIPLLGIHSVLFSFVTDESTSHGALPLRLTKLFIDLFFNSFQGLLVAILYCFVNKEVQSEILKKWRRWKLGRDIEEEYRHTYSQTLQMKSGSIMVHPNTTSRLCSPEEKQALVSNSQNGVSGKQGCLPFTSPPQDGSTCSSITEDTAVTDRLGCLSVALGKAESNL
ncbi:glucagon receptor isoform X1 [Triplophysa dalaica]|uniref:glucagon receptor isoform X1 n=1 Tax=Triplophysa dalaica TaxID=1582913 RepID=UPI0024DF9493|nr:glucagon receptor isoform X1 [Triplophysa dalaica]XP_056609285.1 glucagon receptor isoform X1 [Triplophysa dalaica]